MFKTLTIIGNGFDLHHGIKSRYSQFGAYLKNCDPETASLVEKYLGEDENFWSDLESRLADFDAHTLIEHASDYLVPYSAEDWSDAYHHDYSDEVDRVVTALSKTLRKHFADWIRQLQLPDPSAPSFRKVSLDQSGAFLNFNYTATLQRLYDVPEGNVLHIHGSAANATAQLVLGHGWQPAPQESFNFQVDPQVADTRVLQGNAAIDRYFAETFKPTAKIIAKRQPFFRALHGVEQINVMGHSLAPVDRPYFDEVLRHIDRDTVTCRVSYYGESNDEARARFHALGVSPERVSYLRLEEF